MGMAVKYVFIITHFNVVEQFFVLSVPPPVKRGTLCLCVVLYYKIMLRTVFNS